MPIKGQSKTTKTRTCRLFRKNHTYWRESLDRCWTTRLFAHRLFSVEETDQSSWFFGKRFLHPWICNVSEHTSPHVISESQTPVQDQRCQSGPSARNSVIPSEGGFSKKNGADQKRLQISDPHFDKFSKPTTCACWKKRVKTDVCTCSQFPSEAMLRKVRLASRRKRAIRIRDRSGRPDDVKCQEEARPQNFVIGNDETELELSVESRSFVNRVNDQVRKRQKRISNVTGNGEEHFMISWVFMAVTMESAIFVGKNFQNNSNSIANTTDLTLKCSTCRRNWCLNKMRSQVWRRLVGRIIHGNFCQ